MKYLLIISIFLVFQYTCAFSQKQTFSVSGSVVDASDMSAVEYASVAIFKMPDSLLVTGCISGPGGTFELHSLVSGDYQIVVSFVGYQIKTLPILIGNSNLVLNEKILLERSSVSLNEVEIVSDLNEKQVSFEKTTIQVAQNIASVSGNITDILRTLPSVSIDAEDNVYIRGNKNILILLDGVPTSIDALNSIPASGIESIDIITNPDVRHDAEGTGGIINIVTARKAVSGWSGNLSLNFGFINKINGSGALRFSKGIWDITLNFSGKNEKNTIESHLFRLLHQDTISVKQNILSQQRTSVHSGGLIISARPNKRTSYMLMVKTMFPSTYNTQDINGLQTSGILTYETFLRRNDITFSRKVLETSFSVSRFIVPQKDKISLDVSFSKMKGNRPALYYTNSELLQKSEGGGAPTNASLQFDYQRPMFRNGKLESGLKAFSRWNNFDYRFFDMDVASDTWLINSQLSNDLEHREYIYSAYVMYSDSLKSKTFFKIGARVEYNTSDFVQKSNNEQIEQEYFIPFPYVYVWRKIGKNSLLTFGTNRRITRPNYPQLNPFVVMIDPMTYETGNKYLEPEIQDKAELNYTFVKKKIQLRSNVYYSQTGNYITQISGFQYPDTLILTFVNGDVLSRTGIDIDAGISLFDFASIRVAASAFHTQTSGQFDQIDLSTKDQSWAANISLQLKPEKQTEVQLFFNYSAPQALPQFMVKEIYYADISVKRAFYDRRLSVGLTLSDIFNTRQWEVYSNNAVYSLENYSKGQTRIFWISLSYNFNSYKTTRPDKKPEGENGGIIRLGQ